MQTYFREPFSGFSHLFAAIGSIAALCILVVNASLYGDAWHITSFAIFGTSMILLFSASALYHLLPVSESAIKALKRFDHMMIFVLIAGTYTPLCLVPLRGVTGWTFFGIVWGLAIAGILMKLFWLDAPRWLSTILYLGMGWIAAFLIPELLDTMGAGGLFWLAAGGVSYTLGAVVYALKKPDLWPEHFGFHGLWHLFVIGGAFCHFWCIAYFLV
jgi:hemolysin III